MATAGTAVPAQTTAPPSWGYSNAPYSSKTNRSNRGFRVGITAAFFFWLGSIAWLIASALDVASQPRFDLGSNPPSSVYPNFTGANFTGFYVAAIIGSALWFIASLISLSSVYSEVAVFRQVLGVSVTPLIGRYLIFGAWLTVLGTALVLIGSAIFAGHTLSSTSTGSILWMIGFSIWFFGEAESLFASLATLSMASLMPDLGLRYRAWHQNFATLGNFVALIFYVLGSILFIAQQPPGSYLVGGLLYLFATVLQFLTYYMLMSTAWSVYVPILPYTVAATGLSAAGAGTAAAGGVKGPGGTVAQGPYAGEQKATMVQPAMATGAQVPPAPLTNQAVV